MTANDLDLLRQFSRDHSQDAFTALVQRHVNLVYSTALRHVRSRELAEEVAQSVFSDLARNAARLKAKTVLSAWLYQVTRRQAVDVVRRESRRQARERFAAEMTAVNATPSDWTRIEPLLDDAMESLNETDRAAVLLRYFENKPLREVGALLGASDDAAQKRVSRAVERLREFFSNHGVTASASGLVVLLSANAIQAAPAGLVAAISTTAAALAGTTLSTTASATATKVLAMTTLQKAALAATVVLLAGGGIYEARQASQWRGQAQTLQQQQAPLDEQIQALQRERDDATNLLALLTGQIADLKANQAELLKLRGQVALQKRQSQPMANSRELATSNAAVTNSTNPNPGPLEQYARESLCLDGLLWQMKQRLNLTPQQEAQLEALFKKLKDDRNPERPEAERPEMFSWKFQASVRAVLTPEQAKQYDNLEDYQSPYSILRSDSSHTPTPVSQAASDVTDLTHELGLTQAQQDKAFAMLTNWYAIPPREYRVSQLELLKGALNDEQFALYKRFWEQMGLAAEAEKQAEAQEKRSKSNPGN